ncbi:hypothetical protein Bca4012_065616 [Brassica carinata]|uniref:Uncharacterized protein n=1 Tax=Brassica carinata TaxID=52824 RepID=A0A8X7VNI1_BRACI|nr:hypothetical protein Bca52824_017926 [Brassica carinata]
MKPETYQGRFVKVADHCPKKLDNFTRGDTGMRYPYSRSHHGTKRPETTRKSKAQRLQPLPRTKRRTTAEQRRHGLGDKQEPNNQ